jgi:membrane dipeptidase
MVNFYSGFVVPESGKKMRDVTAEMRAKYPDRSARTKAMEEWFQTEGAKMTRGTYKDVADHIDHIVKVAGIDHVGIGSDFDGITMWPIGLDDVSSYPHLTEELLHRGYSESDVHKVLGANALRAFRQAGEVAKRLRATRPPEVDEIKPERRGR